MEAHATLDEHTDLKTIPRDAWKARLGTSRVKGRRIFIGDFAESYPLPAWLRPPNDMYFHHIYIQLDADGHFKNTREC